MQNSNAPWGLEAQRLARICQIGVCAFCVPWHYVTKQSQLQIGCMKQHEIRCRQYSPPLTHRSHGDRAHNRYTHVARTDTHIDTHTHTHTNTQRERERVCTRHRQRQTRAGTRTHTHHRKKGIERPQIVHMHQQLSSQAAPPKGKGMQGTVVGHCTPAIYDTVQYGVKYRATVKHSPMPCISHPVPPYTALYMVCTAIDLSSPQRATLKAIQKAQEGLVPCLRHPQQRQCQWGCLSVPTCGWAACTPQSRTDP